MQGIDRIDGQLVWLTKTTQARLRHETVKTKSRPAHTQRIAGAGFCPDTGRLAVLGEGNTLRLLKRDPAGETTQKGDLYGIDVELPIDRKDRSKVAQLAISGRLLVVVTPNGSGRNSFNVEWWMAVNKSVTGPHGPIAPLGKKTIGTQGIGRLISCRIVRDLKTEAPSLILVGDGSGKCDEIPVALH